jgi:hypothetical protein
VHASNKCFSPVKNTWRTDRYSPCPRNEAGRYLNFLAGLGYQLSGIEQAVADGTPYTGETTFGDSSETHGRAAPGGDVQEVSPATPESWADGTDAGTDQGGPSS